MLLTNILECNKSAVSYFFLIIFEVQFLSFSSWHSIISKEFVTKVASFDSNIAHLVTKRTEHWLWERYFWAPTTTDLIHLRPSVAYQKLHLILPGTWVNLCVSFWYCSYSRLSLRAANDRRQPTETVHYFNLYLRKCCSNIVLLLKYHWFNFHRNCFLFFFFLV